MTAEAEIVPLNKELAEERAKHTQLRQQLEEALRRLSELEGRLIKDSHSSSKPQSSDGTVRKQDQSMLTALAAVFAGKPLPVAWGT